MNARLLTLVLFAVAPALASADVVRATYSGTSTTTVKYLNPQTFQVFATERYSRKETVIVAAPKSVNGATEVNPFSLTIAPTVHTTLLAGQVYAASARIFTINGTPLLLQYWSLQNTSTGFTGILSSAHADINLAKDRVIALLGGPGGTPRKFQMYDSNSALVCRMTGTATDNQLAIKITGYAVIPGQAVIQFTTKINSLR